MELSLRLELRLGLCAPHPEDAATGIKGIKIAANLLYNYGAMGILIGGLARAIFEGDDPETFEEHKDVDILVISNGCYRHPKQWEEGIDWWITHGKDKRPTNGTTTGLFYNFHFTMPILFSPGLYLCDRRLFKNVIDHEIDVSEVNQNLMHTSGRVKNVLRLPILPLETLSVQYFSSEHSISHYCD